MLNWKTIQIKNQISKSVETRKMFRLENVKIRKMFELEKLFGLLDV
jgi:regulator of replication initiation timing